jgi:hypothetical protein
MNVIDFYVTKILSMPYCEYDRWWVKVKAESHGVESEHQLMFDTEEKAASVNIGYKFLS